MQAVLQGLTEDGVQDQRGEQLTRCLTTDHLDDRKHCSKEHTADKCHAFFNKCPVKAQELEGFVS